MMTGLGGGAGARALLEMVRAQKRGEPRGIWSVCSANSFVLEASLEQAGADGSALLVESTSNQVNPEGGYTGQTPADFARALAAAAEHAGFPLDRLHPRRRSPRPVSVAGRAGGERPREIARAGASVRAGRLREDPSRREHGLRRRSAGRAGPSTSGRSTERTADLAAVAEAAFKRARRRAPPLYVVGTEVPTPGGEQQDQPTLQVTRPDAAQRFLDLTRAAFAARGLAGAWERVIALVVQPGVEFGDETVLPYHPSEARALVRMIESVPTVVFEAHSTDYQSPEALRSLVRDHFAILKVGPALTFALREAVFALARCGAKSGWAAAGLVPSGVRAAARARHDGSARPLGKVLPRGRRRAAPPPRLQP